MLGPQEYQALSWCY